MSIFSATALEACPALKAWQKSMNATMPQANPKYDPNATAPPQRLGKEQTFDRSNQQAQEAEAERRKGNRV
jgi:hypothetical protein